MHSSKCRCKKVAVSSEHGIETSSSKNVGNVSTNYFVQRYIQ